MQVEFISRKGSLAFHPPGESGTRILEGIPKVIYHTPQGSIRQANLADQRCTVYEECFTDVQGTGSQLIVRTPANADGIELTCRINTYFQQPFTLLWLEIHNSSKTPIHLDEFCLLQAEPESGGQVSLPEGLGELRFFKVGWHGWDYSGLRRVHNRNTHTWLDAITSTSYANPATARFHVKGEFSSEGWGVLADENNALVAGFMSTAHQFGQVYTSIRPGMEGLKLSTQADGVVLDPGEVCTSEQGYLQLVPLPHQEPAAEFIDALARQMNARVPKEAPPPMWTHWYHFYHDISEELFINNLNALADQRSMVPFIIVELDDGYQSAWGDWTTTNDKFPHGLGWLASQIKQRGFTPGLWLAPFQVQAKSIVAREHPDWLVQDKRGHPIHAGFQYNMFVQALDSTHPAVLEHFCELMDQACHQWGYAMVKLDFLNAGALPGNRFNPKKTRAEALRMGLEALRQGAGEGAFLLGSGCPFGPAVGIMDAMRIGPDTAPGWEPYFHWMKWAGPLIKKEPSMPSLRNALRHTLNMSVMHKRLWWNDPDCLLVRDNESKLTRHEVQSAVTLVGLSGGMLVSSDDLRSLNASRMGWIRQLVPNLELQGKPLDWLDHEMNRIYQVKLQKAEHTWQLVAVFNWNDQPEDYYLRLDLLGIKPGSLLHVFELWSHQYLRVAESNLLLNNLPAHGCKLLRICEVEEPPQLVADTLHISQGAEIATWQVEGERLVIETIEMGRQVEGELWLSLAKAPQVATCNSVAVEVQGKGEGIYMLNCKFNNKGCVEVCW